MDYEVTLAGKPMGRAQAEKQGLYYHVVCRCRLSGDVMISRVYFIQKSNYVKV